MMDQQDTVTYYARRAPHYDALYAKPERQQDLAELSALLQTTLADRHVLEIACGTGYWTQAIAETAKSVWATDINESMLEIARQKSYPPEKVTFEAIDMYKIPTDKGFDALFGGFIWSHISLDQLAGWLDHLHRLLLPGSRVVFVDNRFVSGSSTPITAPDALGNVFQERKLPDGETFQILKNFPESPDFERVLKGRGQNMQVTLLDYYWMLEYNLP